MLAENAYAPRHDYGGTDSGSACADRLETNVLGKGLGCLGNLHQEHRERRDRSAFKYARRASTGVRERGVIFLEPGDIRDGGAGVRLKKGRRG